MCNPYVFSLFEFLSNDCIAKPMATDDMILLGVMCTIIIVSIWAIEKMGKN